MKSQRFTAILLTAILACAAYGQKISNIKHGSPDYKAIIELVTPYANAHSAHPVRVPGDTMRRSGDWAFISTSMKFVNPNDKGDGSLIALLRKGRRWTIREITVGSGDLLDIAAQWAKKYKLPKGLVGAER